MNRRQCPRFAVRLLGLFMVILALGVTASAEWREKVLYSFQGGSSDGSVPAGGVIFDQQGNLYGATTDGGSQASCTPIGGACGTVFELSPPTQKGGAWTETLIYQFQGEESKDASVPTSGLIIDAAGNLYGVTGYGGTGDCLLVGIKAGCGTVYELSPPQQQGGAWTEAILYSFQGGNDGYFPSGNLVFDKNGNLYGATQFGGGKGTTCNSIYGGQCGTVFKLSPPKQKAGAWTEEVLHSFEGLMGGQQTGDGANPNGGLVLDSKGLTYGTTQIGGYNCPHNSNQGCGTVFALKPPQTKGGIWAEKQVHVFKNGDDGANPNGGLIFDTKGSLYGTAAGGPNQGVGVVFRLTNLRGSMSKETVLYAFNNNGESGADPLAGLTLGAGGDLFGTTSVGSGQSRRGNVFRLKAPARSPGAWSLNVLYGFADGVPDGENPAADLIFDKAGDLYSTTQDGGSGSGCGFTGCGAVFEIKP